MRFDIRTLARPYLEELARRTRETATLPGGRLRRFTERTVVDRDALAVEVAPPQIPGVVKPSTSMPKSWPAESSASNKYLPDDRSQCSR